MALLVVIVLSPLSMQAEEISSCCVTQDFDLYLIGDPVSYTHLTLPTICSV